MATVTCIAAGLSVAGCPAARTFAPGDQIDPDAVVLMRPGGIAVTWRDVLGDHLATHFTVPVAPRSLVPDDTEAAG